MTSGFRQALNDMAEQHGLHEPHTGQRQVGSTQAGCREPVRAEKPEVFCRKV